MAKLTRKDAQELIKSELLSQEQYDAMVEKGYVSSGTRSKRPQIIVPSEKKGEFLDKAYEALEAVAKEMKIEGTEETEDTGKATVYLAGAGSPRSEDSEEDSEEAEDEEDTNTTGPDELV